MWRGVAASPSPSPEALARLELVKSGVETAATLSHERSLPVLEGLGELLPGDRLRRGGSMAVHGPGSASFALALVGQAVREGSFLAVVAPRAFGLAVCVDFDIPLRRVVQFTFGEADAAVWAKAVASVIEGFDLVVVADRRRVSAGRARSLVSRARERGSVLVRVGGPAWAEAPDLRFDVGDEEWHGLGRGHGHLQSRGVTVQVGGRRWPGAPRRRRVRFHSTLYGGAAIEPPPAASRAGAGGADVADVEVRGADVTVTRHLVAGGEGSSLGATA